MRRWIGPLALVSLLPLMFATAARPVTQLAAADTTPPSIAPELSGPAGVNGWHTGAVTVTWAVSDPESGVATSSGCTTTVISGDTTGQAVTCSATNTGGLSAQASVVVKVDATAPSVTGEPTSKPAQRGWYTQPVTVSFSGVDAVSGISGCTAPVVFGGPDTKSAVVSGACTNGAGLSTAATTTLKYDSSPPDVTPSVSGKVGANGWYTGDVSVTWTVSDSVSDVATSSGCGATTVTADTAGTTVTCAATNGAGLSTQRAVTLRIDRSAPDTTITGGPSGTVTSANAAFSFATSESGATFACSLDGGGFEPCSSPQSYAGLGDGPHSFQVRSTDAAGNTDASPAAQSWTVRATPPSLGLPAAQQVEATSPTGAKVTYVVTANATGEPIPPEAIACKPASGSTFALGTTMVSCTVTNTYGVSASGSFTVSVLDSTPPRLSVPGPLTLTSDGALPRTNASISAFLAAARAVDLVDTHLTITSNAPVTFPLGTTVVNFTARDASGNTTSASSSITIQQGRPGSAPGSGGSSSAPDLTPPGDVRLLEAKAGDRSVTLSWERPPDADFHHVDVFRSTATPGAVETRLYSGTAKKVVDRGLQNGMLYHYVVVSVDNAGNRAGGAVATATPKTALLRAPKEGARLSGPPVLIWAVVPDATYYNVQLWRSGTKILSAWPIKARRALQRRWKYDGRRLSLSPGTYSWYVWPGFGDRADRNYGPLLGMQTFNITAPKR
jgi:hypothetical protein